ncbi:SCO1 protein [Salpingoeca rosetta]|uniref:SCO1 protein n=1 Tax=Salpingoeca rosetta (strain ATCC 50818 / BSB-021) TaxID=946362 RepID=F2U9C2_SALR5|nr:SCO1 protein [Salpingoeca rosetta]EGD73325.1 SCO1 protein [Salpingoeca rosetta]|eukprot:XP_004994355.1 SCO1 protein [Salpingoeca rosetta]
MMAMMMGGMRAALSRAVCVVGGSSGSGAAAVARGFHNSGRPAPVRRQLSRATRRFQQEQQQQRPKQQQTKSEPTPPSKTRGSLGRGGPISWKSLVAMLALGGGAVYYFQSARQQAEQERLKRTTKAAGRPALGGPYELVDTKGNKATNEDFLGKWHLLYFGFTFCPDVCPEELEKMAEIVDAIDKKKGKDSITPIFISVDPDRDTPDKVAAYVKQFHPKMVGLTGTHDQIKHICKQFRVYYSRPNPDGEEDYLVDHSIIQYLMAPDGTFVAYYGQNTTAEQATKSILDHMDTYTPPS